MRKLITVTIVLMFGFLLITQTRLFGGSLFLGLPQSGVLQKPKPVFGGFPLNGTTNLHPANGTNVYIPPGTFPQGFYGQAYSVFSVVGIEGQDPQKNPIRVVVSVYNAQGNLVKRVASNPVGQFYCFLPVGDFTVIGSYPGQPLPPRSIINYVLAPPGEGATTQLVSISVSANKLTQVEIDFSSGGI
jgi:hypothetical protein